MKKYFALWAILIAAAVVWAQNGVPPGSYSPAGGNQPGSTSISYYNCAGYGSLNQCFDAAKAYVTSSEAGVGKAAQIFIPQGTYTITAPYVLANGMQIYGVMPRIEYISGSMPDLNMILNGGTVINCGAAANCFTATNARGIWLKILAFTNYTGYAVSVGGNNIEGIAFSNFENLYAIGGTAVNSTTGGFQLYNIQDLQADRLFAYNINIGLALITQSSNGNYGNSTFNDIYTRAYPKSVANSNNTTNSVLIETLTPATGTAKTINNVTFNRLHAQDSSGGDNTGTVVNVSAVSLAGGITGLVIRDADIEGSDLVGLNLTGNVNTGFFNVATGAGNTYDIQIQAGAIQNLISCSAACKIAPGPGMYTWNSFYGQIFAAPTLNSMGIVGAYTNYSNSNMIIAQGLWQDQFGFAGLPITSNAFINQGQSTFTLTGCSVSAHAGGGSSGTYTSGTNGACTVVITMATDFGAGITAPNGWFCEANDLTTNADLTKQTASSQTTATLSGTTVSGDVINFSCSGY